MKNKNTTSSLMRRLYVSAVVGQLVRLPDFLGVDFSFRGGHDSF